MSNNNRGRKSSRTDEELKLIALEIKFKRNSVKLTPSLLERETSIGRNTWSRRILDYINELNNPILTNRYLNENEDIVLPSIELLFKKFENNHSELKRELISFEQLFHDTYTELQNFKKKESKFNNINEVNEKLEIKLKKQIKKAAHFEQLYNETVVSSAFIHLVENKKSKVYKFEKKPLDMNSNLEKNLSLENLGSFFPKINSDINGDDDDEKNKNFKKLQDEFNL